MSHHRIRLSSVFTAYLVRRPDTIGQQSVTVNKVVEDVSNRIARFPDPNRLGNTA